MKNWRDNKGNVWHRGPVKDSVTIHREWVLPIGDGCLEWVTIPGQRLNKNDREDAIAAIAKLWPPSTKVQLLRKVRRLAGRYFFVTKLGFRAARVTSAGTAVGAIRELITGLRDAGKHKQAARLEGALTEYEAAK